MLDVLIIGGGVSGLACCHRLLKSKKDLKVKVIEAKGRLGGRILGKSVQSVNGCEAFDLGGQWVSRSQIHAMRLLEEFGLEVYDQPYDGKTVNVLNDKDIFHTNSPTDVLFISFPFAYDIAKGMKKLEELSQELSIEDPLSHPNAKEWDSMSMETAKRWLFKHEWSRKVVDIAFITMFGFDATSASLLYVLLYAKSAGSITALIDDQVPGNAQEYKVKGGMFNLVTRLSQYISEDRIKLNSPVVSIEQNEDACIVKTVEGIQYEADHVVLAIPPHLTGKISMSPELPKKTNDLMKNLKVGSLVKCIATYKEQFWKRNGFSGVSLHWPYYRGDSSLYYPISLTYDATSFSGAPALVGFIGGALADKIKLLSDSQIKEAIINSFALLFGDEARTPIDVVFQDWTQEEYNGGCPVTFALPGAASTYGDVCLRRKYGRVHFAGTETATLWRGFISGAIQSGYRAADEILSQIDDAYTTTDDVTWDDIALPATLSYQRNNYYTLNGLLVAGVTIAVGLLGFVLHHFL